ncbi:MAG: flagellar biosynthesis protein FlgD [Peptococcaceae bacterium]|nr:flagellar biosynthesis protein FlgD [Peptococcaceae bacterium]
MSSINATSGWGTAVNMTGQGNASPAMELKQDFLKLLIAQLQNQDPMSPMENSQFVSQLAQFSSLEQMTNVASAVLELRESLIALNSQSLLTQGAAMIGKEVTGMVNTGKKDENGDYILEEISGIVSSVKWADGSLTLLVGDVSLKLEDIVEIRDTGISGK